MEAWNRDDFDAWIDQFDPDVEWCGQMEVFRGHAGARQAWEGLKGEMQFTVQIDDIRDLGESILMLGQLKGTGRTTGLNVMSELAQLVTYRDDKIISARDFGSRTEALQAVGMKE